MIIYKNMNTITPIAAEPKEIIRMIRDIFGLNEYPFDGMDNDIIFLAFMPKCYGADDLKEKLKGKYGTCDHQTLEFYME